MLPFPGQIAHPRQYNRRAKTQECRDTGRRPARRIST